MLTFSLISLDELSDVAKMILAQCRSSKIFTFTGNLGAGKTTLIQYMCQQLDCKDVVTSPTFSLINEYKTKQGPVYHMDLYRVKDEAEAFDIGIEEYLFSDNYCFIEWPDVIDFLLDMDVYHVIIQVDEDGFRKIEVSKLPLQS